MDIASRTAAALLLAAAAWSAHGQSASGTSYRVVNLGPGEQVGVVINERGQVAYSLSTDRDAPVRAMFYDGKTIEDIGTLGADFARVTGLNDNGQITGISGDRAGNVRSFVWSRGRGMVDVGSLPGANETWEPSINNLGEIAGYSSGTPRPYARAFRWTMNAGIEDIGALTGDEDRTSQATAINNAGLIAGSSLAPGPAHHAFAWTRAGGMVDIDTLNNTYSTAEAVGDRGQVAGNFFVDGGRGRAFMWTRRLGMRDLGTAGRDQAWMVAMSRSGQVVGVTLEQGSFNQTAMTWTRDAGMRELGTLGGTGSTAFGVNNRGQVVGAAGTASDDYHAFLWTAKDGMLDLNRRLRNAPATLTLYAALAIADSGAIVASSNAGLVLLQPACGCPSPHTLGPIIAPATVAVGAPFDASVDIASAERAGKQYVTWSWGDGSRSGAGRHHYAAPGIYTVTATATDLAGRSAVVSRRIVARTGAGGTGTFLSPVRPSMRAPFPVGVASFAFVADTGQLLLNVGRGSFRSTRMAAVGHGRFLGEGTLNGSGDYQFSLTASSGNARAGRLTLRIWHIDPASGQQVLDYANGASRILDGNIAVD